MSGGLVTGTYQPDGRETDPYFITVRDAATRSRPAPGRLRAISSGISKVISMRQSYHASNGPAFPAIRWARQGDYIKENIWHF